MAALAGGSLPFLGAVIIFLFAVVLGLFTRKGSGIEHHAYKHVYSGAPGAALPCEDFSGADRTFWTEQAVAARWKPVERRSRSMAPVREATPSDRMPIRSPVAAPRRPC
jgi:hypothetical protein